MKQIYLVPTVISGGGAVLEYRLEELKKDMRKKFCKENVKNEVSLKQLVNAIAKNNVIIKEQRVILNNGKDAYEFRKCIKKGKCREF